MSKILEKQRAKCVVSSCISNRINFPNRKFFTFPKIGSTEYDDWMSCCTGFVDIRHGVRNNICQVHFEKRHIGKKRLKKNAIPILALGVPREESLSPCFDKTKATKNYGRKILNTNSSDVSFTSTSNILKPIRTYGRAEDAPDFTIDELNLSSKYIAANCNSPIPSISCECKQNLQLLKQIKNLRKEVMILRKHNKALKVVNKRLTIQTKRNNKKIRILRKKKIEYKKNNNVLEIIDNVKVNENSKTFSKLILTQPRIYSENEKKLSQCIYFRSSKCYNFLREVLGFHLPHVTSLHKWVKLKHLSPGVNISILKEVKKQVENLSEKDKEVMLIFDEMSIEESLVYDKFKDQIEGYEVLGDGKRRKNLAKNILVFMIRSISGHFKHVLFYIATSSAMTGIILKEEIFRSLEICDNLGLNVRGIVCDQGPINRKLLQSLEVSENKTYFHYNFKEIYSFYDVPHLFKTLRNRLLHSDIETPDGLISWRVVSYLYNDEKDKTTKVCPKLSYAHVNPTNFQKMSVRLAVQVLSHSVAAGIRSLLALSVYPKDLIEIAKSTAIVFEKINRLFDILNGTPILKRESSGFEFLREMKEYVLNMKNVKGKGQVFCFKGIAMSIESTIKISLSLFDKQSQIEYISTRKLNQDPLENLFAHIRSRNGNKTNPSLYEVNQLMAKIITLKLLFSTEFSNCEKDEDEYFAVDWEAVLDQESFSLHSDEQYATNEHINSIDSEDSELPEPCNLDSTLCTNDIAIKYFSGYCYQKLMKNLKVPCENCNNAMVTKNDSSGQDLSNILIDLRQYENCPETKYLITPSETFFKICRSQTYIFKEIFHNKPTIENLRSTIRIKCIDNTKILYPDWFNENSQCDEHRIRILDFMILVLIRKNCKWTIDNYRSAKLAQRQNKNKKLRALLHE